MGMCISFHRTRILGWQAISQLFSVKTFQILPVSTFLVDVIWYLVQLLTFMDLSDHFLYY